jgi:hypothetical protein
MLEAEMLEALQGEKDSLEALQGVLDAGGHEETGAFTTKAVEQAMRAMEQAMVMRARREAVKQATRARREAGAFD